MKSEKSVTTQVLPKKFKLSHAVFTVWLLTFFVVLVGIVFGVGLFYHTWWYYFKTEAHLTDSQVVAMVRQGLQHKISQTNGHKNILILGIDQLSNRENEPVLTDTVLLVSIDTQSGAVHMISIPRDLWSSEYKTKINALYTYGKDRYPDKPELFPTEVIANLTQVPIHHTLLISLDQLKELIDAIGGVQIKIPESFTDTQFPRSDVDIKTEHDLAKLYETVSFKQGEELMAGDRALIYLRSRHSENKNQGTDDARSLRQQAVIAAIIQKLQSNEVIQNARLLGKVVHWYRSNYETVLSSEELIQLAYHLRNSLHSIALDSYTLSISTPDVNGVIFHPPQTKYSQWVYEIEDLAAFQQEIHQKLAIE